MSNKFIVFGLFIFISGIVGERENVTVVKENDNQGRSGRDLIYRGLIVCAFRYDADCFMNVAQNFLDLKRTQLLAQADQEVARASGSSSVQAKPSQVAQTIEKLFSDLAGLFRDGFSSLFSSKDDDDDLSSEKSNDAEKDDDDDEDDDDKKEGNSSRDVGEARKKKKKNGPLKKLFRLIKIVILTIVVFLKVALLVKIFEAALKLKMVLLGAGFLILYVVRIWLDQRNRKNQHDEVGGIVYKNPLDAGSAEWAGPGVPGGFHARNSVDEEYAQRIAYDKQLE